MTYLMRCPIAYINWVIVYINQLPLLLSRLGPSLLLFVACGVGGGDAACYLPGELAQPVLQQSLTRPLRGKDTSQGAHQGPSYSNIDSNNQNATNRQSI